MTGRSPSVAPVDDRHRATELVAALRAGVAGLILLLPLAARAVETSESMPLAAKSLLLDVAAAGARLVAVGDRGHVLVSDDRGATWRQVVVPTRAMLTGVSFADAQHGCAVGHDGVILLTADGGQTWTRQDDGKDLDSVWLDATFATPRDGFAVGAYGKCLVTHDTGRTWAPAQPIEEESHYNQVAAGSDHALFIAGESGLWLASHDGGATWQRGQIPYDGSLFGTLPAGGDRLIVYGLRGHVLVSEDRGAHWSERESPAPVLLQAGLVARNGVIVLAGQGGNFLVSRDHGRTFTLWKPAAYNGSVAALMETDDGALLVVGELGAARLPLPEATSP